MQVLISKTRCINRSEISIEENAPFLESAGKTENLEDSYWSVPNNNRRQILRLSLVVNAVLSVLCILLSSRALLRVSNFDSDLASGQNISDEQIADPYCENTTTILFGADC